MIPSATRIDIINNRFAYTPDEVVTVNASQLCAEIIAHDKLKYQAARLQSRFEILVALLDEKPQYRHIDLKA